MKKILLLFLALTAASSSAMSYDALKERPVDKVSADKPWPSDCICNVHVNDYTSSEREDKYPSYLIVTIFSRSSETGEVKIEQLLHMYVGNYVVGKEAKLMCNEQLSHLKNVCRSVSRINTL